MAAKCYLDAIKDARILLYGYSFLPLAIFSHVHCPIQASCLREGVAKCGGDASHRSPIGNEIDESHDSQLFEIRDTFATM